MTGRLCAWIAYVALCVIWGTTYNAIRICVEVFNPFYYGGVRFLVAGLIMFVLGLVLGQRFPRRGWLPAASSGFLMLVLGNGFLSVAEMHVESGPASVVSALSPIVVALMVCAFPGEERLGWMGWIGVLAGFAGVAVLFRDRFGLAADREGIGALLLCVFFWSLGTVVQRRYVRGIPAVMTAAVQMMTAGVGLSALWPLLGGPVHAPVTARAVAALGYLIVIGACVGFFCFAYLLGRMPVTKAVTLGYVNPVVAVAVGVALLGETVAGHQIAGMAMTIAGVCLVHASRRPAAGVASA